MPPWIATVVSGTLCLGGGYVVLRFWPVVQNTKIVQRTPNSTFGRIGLASAVILFMSLLIVQNGLVSGTDWKFVAPYMLGCAGLCVSSLKQFNAGLLVLNAAFTFLMIYSLVINGKG